MAGVREKHIAEHFVPMAKEELAPPQAGTNRSARHCGAMDKIKRPLQPGNYPDRDVDCQEAMDIAIVELVDAASRARWTIPEALNAIARVIPHQRKAYYIDPDPSDDPMA